MNAATTLFIYGPPGSGKTTTGRLVAENLDLPFVDLDAEIEKTAGASIPAIFETEGEPAFRSRELESLQRALARLETDSPRGGVVALGGGALTVPETRERVEASGQVVLLTAPLETLLTRLQGAVSGLPGEPGAAERPLLAGDMTARLSGLLARRAMHYASFPVVIETGDLEPAEIAWQAGVRLGLHRVKKMGQPYDVRVQEGGLGQLGSIMMSCGLRGPVNLVCDENVARFYAQTAAGALESAGYHTNTLVIPAGEAHKTMDTVQELWAGFLAGGVERTSTVVALGGGVTGDLAGFAAATIFRGVSWVNVPTTILATVDSSLGGKTGADLPQGKNLVGAFHPPALVLADPETLASLPAAELLSGMAEVVKHGLIADPGLFELASRPPYTDLGRIVRRGMAVKVRVIEIDPYERGLRAALNLGHTVGHAVEKVSNYKLRHGEAIAIGMVAEARLAEHLGIAESGLAETIAEALSLMPLPTAIPTGMDRGAIARAMQMDKKKAAGVVRFALPVTVGEVVTGVEVTDFDSLEAV